MFVHTITLNDGSKETRKSQNRQYAACLVATHTEASVALVAADRVKVEQGQVERRAKLEALLAQHGTTVEAARARLKELTARWNAEWRPTGDRVRADLIARGENTWGTYDATNADMLARGFVDPRKTPESGIDSLAGDVDGYEKSLRNWKTPALGREHVLSWHLTLPNARKAVSASIAAWHAERGYRLSVRTDFQVRETAKRAKAS